MLLQHTYIHMCLYTFYIVIYTLQGLAIFFFHVVRNKEVCTYAKLVLLLFICIVYPVA